MYRHGDVIVAPVKELPANLNRRHSAVLARGEATGHSHRIADPQTAELYDGDDAGVGYIQVVSDVAFLIHDEHKPISLPQGVYRFWQQREYSPKEIRRIVD